jgi:hypothetical protein
MSSERLYFKRDDSYPTWMKHKSDLARNIVRKRILKRDGSYLQTMYHPFYLMSSSPIDNDSRPSDDCEDIYGSWQPSDNCEEIYGSSPGPKTCDCQNQLGHFDWNGIPLEDLPDLCKQTIWTENGK